MFRALWVPPFYFLFPEAPIKGFLLGRKHFLAQQRESDAYELRKQCHVFGRAELFIKTQAYLDFLKLASTMSEQFCRKSRLLCSGKKAGSVPLESQASNGWRVTQERRRGVWGSNCAPCM